MPEIFDSKKKATAAGTVVGTTDPQVNETERPHRDVVEYSMVMRDEPASNNPFRAFLAKPTRIFFASQHHEEKVLLLLRRHPITQLGWISIALILAMLPSLFASIGLVDFLPVRFQVAAAIGWYLIVMGFVLESFLSWFYNVFIITDERVIDVDFNNLLYKNISAAKIDNIEDVTQSAGGVLASIFNYGTIRVQTAGAVTEFEFNEVPQPAKVAAFLNEMIVEEEKEDLEGRVN